MTLPDDFDTAAAKVAGQNSADPVDAAAASVVKGQRTALRSSLYGALLENPDVAARAQKLGRQTGIPADVVGRNLPEVERNAKLDEFDRVLERSPTVAQWLADQNNAKVAHDDVENLSEHERLFREALAAGRAAQGRIGETYVRPTGNMRPLERSILQSFTEPVRRGLAQGSSAMNVLFESLGVFDGLRRRQDEVRAAFGMESDRAARIDVANQDLQRQVGRFPVPEDIAQGMRAISGAQTFGDALSAALDNPRAVLETTLQSLGTSAPGLVAAAAGSTAGPFGTATGAALGSFAVEYSNTLQEVLQESGKPLSQALADPELMGKAREKALKRGVPVAAFDGITAGLAGRLLAGAKPTATSVASRAVGELGLQAGGGAAGETAAQAATGEYKPGDILMEALAELPTAITEVPSNYRSALRSAQAAEQRTQFIERVNQLAAASKVRQRDVDTFEKFIDQAAEGAPVQNVYIDANTLAQSGVADQLAALSPSVAEQLPAALATGGEIQIPVAEYTARIAGSELSQSLIEDIRVEGEQFTRRQAQEFMQNLAQELEAEVQRLAEEQRADEVFKVSADEVKSIVKQELDTANRFGGSVNDAYASLVARRFAVLAADLGTTPTELFNQYRLGVRAEGVQGGQVLSQSENERNLIVAHNLTADNLRNALEIGGLPVPSLAITKVDTPIQGFGDITLVGDKSLATPSAKNPVFNADVYSPRFPDVKVKVDDGVVMRSLESLYTTAREAGLYAPDPGRIVEELGRNQFNRAVGDIVSDVGMRYGYAVEVLGKNIEVPKKEVAPAPVSKAGAPLIEQSPLRELLPTLDLGKLTPDTAGDLGQKVYAALVNKTLADAGENGDFDKAMVLVNRRIQLFAESTIEPGSAEFAPEKVGKMTVKGLYSLYNTVRNSVKAEESAAPAPRVETDFKQLNEILDAEVDTEQMRQWVQEKLRPAIGEKRIVKEGGKTVAFSLANIVKSMTSKVRDAEGFNYGLGNARSKGAKAFKSLSEVQAQRDQVQGAGLTDAAIKENQKRFDALVDNFDEFLPDSGSIYSPSTFDALADAVGLSYSTGVDSALREVGFKNVPADLVKDLEAFAADLVNLPTEYFEAKPQRAVGVNEFKGAVIPDSTPSDVRDALVAQGLTLTEYVKGDEQSRANAVRQLSEALDSQRGDVLFQTRGANRGSFSPSTNTITLLKSADLSTFLHESAHYFLEVQFDIAARLEAQANGGASLSDGEKRVLDDSRALLKWFGINSFTEWYGLDFEAMRPLHEQFARGFEAYVFEGRAPSLELQGLFQRFRAWLVEVYKDIKALNVELTDEVRGVMDRMLATSEEIELAEQGRSMMPLFTSPEQAGMTPQEFAAYQALGVDATNEAIQDLQARGLRNMQWMHNARGREVKRLQKQSAELRREVKMEVTREVMSQPVYRAWQFLTAKIEAADKLDSQVRAKSDPNVVDPTVDSLHTAIAKLGGINKDEVVKQWGTDPKDKPVSGVFGKPVWRANGGKSIDAMAEALGELGYLPLDDSGKVDIRDLEERFDAELRGEPVYSIARDYSGMGEQRAGDGINVSALSAGRFDLTELRAMGLPAELVDRLQSLRMTSKNGLHPDIVGEMFGFTSGDELVRALAAADKPADAIEGLTDARMLQDYSDLATPEAIERAADKAIHNEVRAKFVATEANALAKATGGRKILTAAAKAFAEQTIARLKVRNIRPGQYATAEVRAAKESVKASQSGDLAKAAAEKRNQLVQNYLTKAAYEAQDEVDSGLRYLKKFDSDSVRKALDADYTDQIDALLERFDLRKQSLKAIDKRTALASWIESQREQGLEPEIPEALKNEAFRKSYRDMTVEEFRGLIDSVKQIEHLGRLKNKLLTAADNRAFDAIKADIVASIEANSRGRKADARTPTTNLGRAWQSVKNFGAAHIKAATWARIMDGGKDGGPVWEYLIRSANERGNRETQMRADATLALTNILAPVFQMGRMGGAGQFFPTIGRSLNREARLAIALNTGNAGNLQRLLGGEGWAVDQIRPVLESLTAAEWQAVQAVWDHFESYRPQIAAKERRVYGREPDWVDPSPFTVTTSDGQTIDVKGGYYPIKYDPAASQRAEEFADAEGAKRQLQGAFTSATTRRSFTKTRSEEVSGRPLLYTLAGLYGGVNDVIHDLAWHEWLIDANRILRSKTIDAAIRGTYGPEVKQQFKTWVQDIAEGDRGAQNAAEAALGRLRQGVSAAGLGFNVTSAAMQITGFNQSIVRVGAKWIGKGLGQFIASPIAKTREVVGKSTFMADRSRTQFRELNELRNRVQDESATMRTIKLGTYFLMMRMQRAVDVPTWLGAYEKAMSEGNAEDRAIALADQAVMDSQGSGMTKDLAAVERGGPALKLFTVYYSYMNTALNMGVAQAMTAKSKAKLAADLLMLYTVPAVLGSALKDALTPGGGDDDEDLEKIARKLAAEQLSYLMGLFVVAREFGEVSKIVTGAEGPKRDYAGPAGLRPIADTFKFVQQANQGEFDTAFRKASINLLGDFTGLPSAQINRTINGIEALEEGQTDNPAAVLFGYQK